MKLRNLILIISSLFILLSPCSVKASVDSIFKTETTHTKSTSSKACSLKEYKTTQKNEVKADVYFINSFQEFIYSTNKPINHTLHNENDVVKYTFSKIPYYLLYKQLKFSLL